VNDVITILLVDDEPRNLDALEAILDHPSYRLLRAGDADRALKLLLENDVAAIVLDIKMPGVSGFELATLIKGTKRFREIPILFLTAYMLEDQDIVAGYGAGAVDYLIKPVNPQILRQKLGVFAELFRKTRQLAELNETLESRVAERTAELAASEAALRETSQQKDVFLATLAHELRNPLAPLRTGLDLLLHASDPSAEQARTLAAMNRQLDHMVRLIDDLLDVARISRGMLQLSTAPAELSALVDTAIDITRPFADRRKQSIEFAKRDLAEAIVDSTRLCQIIGNLLHNASKYTPVGGVINVELERSVGAATIRVIDRGAGIPSGQLDHVFDMFAKIERSLPNSNGGLGIGLALSRRLAELHGGTLTAISEGEGRGATFTLSVPVAPFAVGTGTQEAVTPLPLPLPPPPAGPAGRKRGPSLNIVVVEDNEDAAETLAMWLEGIGHTVRVAHTGPAGLDLIRETGPDVVLCDVGLPGMDGVEVCRRAKALELARTPLMVALTGWGMDADRRRTDEAGFDHHLVKPVAPDKLREILATLETTATAP
jgi:signal transduction histidine kinase